MRGGGYGGVDNIGRGGKGGDSGGGLVSSLYLLMLIYNRFTQKKSWMEILHLPNIAIVENRTKSITPFFNAR